MSLQELFEIHAHDGQVRWLGVRPERGAPMLASDAVQARVGRGLTGDRYNGSRGVREVTLVQWEHLPVVASLLGRDALAPELLRRNIAVSGINLLALRNRTFAIGEAILEGTGLCHPCSKMESALGTGGYNALRGHGGITAKVVREGIIRLNDPVRALGSPA